MLDFRAALAAWAQRRRQAIAWPAPAPPAAIGYYQRQIGITLPADVQAYFAELNGGPCGIEGGFRLLSLATSYIEWRRRSALAPPAGPVTAAGHDAAVQPVGWHPAWVPIAVGALGDSICIDLAPARAGRFGQVILVPAGTGGCVRIAASLRAWFADLVGEPPRAAVPAAVAGPLPVDQRGGIPRLRRAGAASGRIG